jgi:hypothetical protein
VNKSEGIETRLNNVEDYIAKQVRFSNLLHKVNDMADLDMAKMAALLQALALKVGISEDCFLR